jgi:hypothetical protein
MLSRIAAMVLVFGLILASPGARAADLGELHRLFGIGVGETARPPANLRSLATRATCLCPDFCTADLPELGPQGAMSVRWTLRDGTCRADFLTVEGRALQIVPVVSEPAHLFGLSPEQIIARYGPPRIQSDIAGGQLIYCGLVGDYMRTGVGTIANELIFTGFLFDAGRLHTIRVGMSGNCPMNAFLPASGEL